MAVICLDNRATKGFSLKDQLFNAEKVHYLAGLFAPPFDAENFEREVMDKLAALELMARLNYIAEVMGRYLPTEFEAAARAIRQALPEKLDPTKTDDDFGVFIHAPFAAFVAANGLDHPKIALPLLREITMRFSAEFYIRAFINAHPEETMAQLAKWAIDNNYHVRRLVSEGTRPTLPWGKKITIPIEAPIALLDILHSDKTRFVTRSVANHLNDISKKEPDLVILTLKRWAALAAQERDELDWITRHALRSLVKKGHAGALAMLGYRAAPEITVSAIKGPSGLEIGTIGAFEFTISAAQDEKLMIDYVIDFIKKNGESRPKVFKLKKLEIKAGETVKLSKHHRFLKDATTFTHYAGPHRLWVQINGTKHGLWEFALE